MTEETTAFGPRLRAGRLAARLSQQDLAERSGLSVRAISDLEGGRTRHPYQHSVERLAQWRSTWLCGRTMSRWRRGRGAS